MTSPYHLGVPDIDGAAEDAQRWSSAADHRGPPVLSTGQKAERPVESATEDLVLRVLKQGCLRLEFRPQKKQNQIGLSLGIPRQDIGITTEQTTQGLTHRDFTCQVSVLIPIWIHFPSRNLSMSGYLIILQCSIEVFILF